MQVTIEAFEERDVECFYNSHNPAAKKERWARREAKITNRKNRINAQTAEKLIDCSEIQPPLFD